MLWRSVLLAAYIGVPLTGCIVWGGGWAWLVLFAVWGVVWFGFSLLWGWALRVRQMLLRQPHST